MATQKPAQDELPEVGKTPGAAEGDLETVEEDLRQKEEQGLSGKEDPMANMQTRGQGAMATTEERCAPCREGSPPATSQERAEWMKKLPGWAIQETNGIPELERVFKFKDFRGALDFTVVLGRIADDQDHHPTVVLEWGRATVRWSTHKIKNLHRNDFIMAAKTDEIYSRRFSQEKAPKDKVQEASEESFPASDAPAWR